MQLARLEGRCKQTAMFLGVDLGTSSLKVVLLDQSESLVAEAAVPLTTTSLHPSWCEQDPDAWWSAFRQALGELQAQEPRAFRAVRALGLSGQMHAALLVDRRGDAVRPAMLWNDGRAVEECAELQSAVPDLASVAGIVAMPGFTAPKILWLRNHEPESFSRLSTVLLAKDFLRLKLTGEAVTDMSDAAGTLYLDQQRRDWSDDILAATGLDRSVMPRLAEGNDAAGSIHAEGLREFGIDGPVVVAAGAGDVAAAAIGIGAIADGDAFVSLGTSAQLFVTDESYRPQPSTLLHAFAHALPGRWFRMAAMLNGVSCLNWVARIVGEPEIEKLLDRCESAYRRPSRVLFLPYLSGERTPHNDARARGALVGLDPSVEAVDLVQATLEGVAFSLLEARQLLEASDATLTSVAAVGGGARSRFLMQLVAHVLGVPVVRHAGRENGPAIGAARLARMALTGESAEQVCVKPPVLDVLEPDRALTAAYGERFETYRRLYPALKGLFRSELTSPP
jgi:xylulokinase